MLLPFCSFFPAFFVTCELLLPHTLYHMFLPKGQPRIFCLGIIADTVV